MNWSTSDDSWRGKLRGWFRPISPVRVVHVARPPLTPEALRGALAVADDNSLWLAVHQVIDDLEQETIRTARDLTGQPALCAGAVSAGEALAMLRRKLERLRDEGIKGVPPSASILR